MAHNVSRAFPIAEKPWIVQVTDDATHTFLQGLISSPESYLDTPEEQLLWAAGIGDGSEGGSAYVVSHEAYKRVRARRFS